MRAARLVLAAAVGLTGVVGTMTAAGAGAEQKPACTGRTGSAGHGWSALHPRFPDGPQRVTQAVAPAYAPDRIYATNGTSVVATGDAGCHWSPVVVPDPGGRLGVLPEPLDGLLTVPTTMHIAAIAAPSSATQSNWIYVAFNDTSAATSQPRIASFDGTRWHAAKGLPRFGTVTAITVCANIPTSAFALVDVSGSVSGGGGLYSSSDGGVTFEQRNADVTAAGLPDLRVDPAVNTRLYARGPHGLQVSEDGGRSFHAGPRPADDIESYDVTPGAGSSRLVLGHANRRSFERSSDAGLTFLSAPAPVDAKRVAIQPILDRVAVSDGKSLWLQVGDDAAGATEVTPRDGPPQQLQFSAPSAAGYAVLGVRDGVVLRRVATLDDVLLRPPPGGGPILLASHAPPHQFPSTLLPDQTRVHVPAGGHRDVRYRLLLPRTPSVVDVMFLVDTSSSTEATINGLKHDLATIVNDLSRVGLDTQFGVADFKDYSPRVADLGDGELGDYAYRLDRVIGPADSSLRDSLAGLRASGGGDPAESQLTALYQSTTGVGQRYPRRHSYIKGLRPGGDAHYRPGSLRLAVLATDDRFHRERDYLTPSWDATVAALHQHRVHPIGLAMEHVDVQTGKSGGFRSYRVEQELATATGTLAPDGGVDCNGDLVPDVPAGAPFVCKVPAEVSRTVDVGPLQTDAQVAPVKLAAAISRAAETLPDMRAAGLTFRGDTHHIARVVSPARPPRVNLKNDNALSFTVRYTCPRLHKAHSYGMTVDAAAGNNVVAHAKMRVACDAIAAKSQRIIPPAAAAAVAAPAAPAPAPPAPGNPIPNPNPNPNPNPAANANVGFASQQEEQRQLAFAGADAGAEAEPANEMSMSRLRGRPSAFVADDGGGSAQTWLFGAAALMLTGAAGYAARTRTRTRPATCQQHTRR